MGYEACSLPASSTYVERDRFVTSSKTRIKSLYTGRFVELVVAPESVWEYARRPACSGVVVVVALTRRNELVLVEQFRPPVDAHVLELPAGLAGDTPRTEGEPLLAAAKRELLEETGYVSDNWSLLGRSAPSAGITDELHSYFLARQCWREGEGGGDENEDIVVSTVPMETLRDALTERNKRGDIVSSTVWAGLGLLS